ncbi:hypothetical protein FH972_025911 [Carpinus fangiana]|uniref:Carboxypeptidase n=1 Tax=Carpinus fangiana TaxID=176857 RepID=A0A5N6L2D7_9ROSI|nr:hypothetical protein FH972_025911 [Carpinus fangiana]
MAQDKVASDYFVRSLTGAPEGPLLKMHAGHIEVDAESSGHMFFWHYENRHIGDKKRTVIWLNGGPGCSSMDGALMEVGPYRVRPGGNLEYNNGSWDEFANLLFVDNPVGTGFSYVSGDHYLEELQQMADQFLVFLKKFFSLFPHYEADDLYLAGESYAGQHIPYIAKAILDSNKNANDRTNYQLKGLLIGNGWISGPDQYPSYSKFAYEQGLLKPDTDAARTIETQLQICLKKLDEGGADHVDVPECEAILQDILSVTRDKSAPADQECVNVYDVRLRDSYASCGMSWPPDLTSVTPYLRTTSVVRELHVDQEKRTGWSECSGAVSEHFRARKSIPSYKLLPDILSEVPITLFSGDKDLICNHIGTESLINNMEWNDGKGMETSPGTLAPRRDWVFEGEPAGYWQEARNLTYVVFYNASHMVPFDYPRRTRDMLDRTMGVDIGSIGGVPTDSRIDGEKGLETSVGGHPNSTAAEEAEKQKLSDAQWHAYYKSGEVALVLVIIAAGAWFYYVWRDRRRRAGYAGVDQGDVTAGGMLNGALRNAVPSMEGFRRNKGKKDLEAADFDANELDDIDPRGKKREAMGQEVPYDLASDSDDSDGEGSSKERPKAQGYHDT